MMQITHPRFEDYRSRLRPESVVFEHSHSVSDTIPPVSIVTSVFNGGKTLQSTIDSVRAQKVDGMEYVIVDANSNDNTREIVEANRDVVTKYVRQKDEGIYDGMNFAIALARGKVIKVINADDLLSEDAVRHSLQVLAESDDPDNSIVNGYLDIINESGDKVDVFTERWITKSVPAFLHPSWFVPRAVYERLGLYSLDFRIASDYEYYLYARPTVQFLLQKRPLAEYRTDGRSAGFEGMREAIKISNHYLPWTTSRYIAGIYWMQKIRKLVLTRLLGEKGFYRLKRLVGR